MLAPYTAAIVKSKRGQRTSSASFEGNTLCIAAKPTGLLHRLLVTVCHFISVSCPVDNAGHGDRSYYYLIAPNVSRRAQQTTKVFCSHRWSFIINVSANPVPVLDILEETSRNGRPGHSSLHQAPQFQIVHKRLSWLSGFQFHVARHRRTISCSDLVESS